MLPYPADRAVRETSSLEDRRAAVAAALRAVRDEPSPTAVSQPSPPPPRPAPSNDEIVALRADVRRLAERVERVEDKVDMIHDGDDAPLTWPVEVTNDRRLEVPPLEVSRGNSPAFDVLLGPSQRDSA